VLRSGVLLQGACSDARGGNRSDARSAAHSDARRAGRRCVFFGKPLLESGTMGTKCNVQCVIPHVSINYDGRKDQDTKVRPAARFAAALPLLCRSCCCFATFFF
jgi:hypothetical protein